MYQVIVNSQENGSSHEFFSKKSEVIRFIARETGVSQKSIANEVNSRSDSEFKRDSQGFRVEIAYVK